MLTDKELERIRKALPKDGYQRVANKTGLDKSTVGKVLRKPQYFNKIVIDATLEVIEKYKAEVAELKNKVKSIV